MTKSVWRRAAEAIDRKDFYSCCVAVVVASGSLEENNRFVNMFVRYFRPHRLKSNRAFWPDEARNERVIALLLMDELEKDGQI